MAPLVTTQAPESATAAVVSDPAGKSATTQAPLVSIIIPHFQTLSLAQLCLRSICRYTQQIPYEVIVVDNGSRDGASLDYLRRVEWIRLIERRDGVGPTPAAAHKQAMDIGIAASRAPYLLSYHTDTVAVRDDWLVWLVEQLRSNDRIAAVGTHKLELRSALATGLKHAERLWDLATGRRGDDGDSRPYIRSHCALYRREILERLGLRFTDNASEAAGRTIHLELERNGYEARLLPIGEMLQRVVHLNHGTMALVPELGARRRTIRRGNRRIRKFLSQPAVLAVYNDDSLDKASRSAP